MPEQKIFADIAATLVTATIRNRGHYADRLTSSEPRLAQLTRPMRPPDSHPFVAGAPAFVAATQGTVTPLIRRKRDGDAIFCAYGVEERTDEDDGASVFAFRQKATERIFISAGHNEHNYGAS